MPSRISCWAPATARHRRDRALPTGDLDHPPPRRSRRRYPGRRVRRCREWTRPVRFCRYSDRRPRRYGSRRPQAARPRQPQPRAIATGSVHPRAGATSMTRTSLMVNIAIPYPLVLVRHRPAVQPSTTRAAILSMSLSRHHRGGSSLRSKNWPALLMMASPHGAVRLESPLSAISISYGGQGKSASCASMRTFEAANDGTEKWCSLQE